MSSKKSPFTSKGVLTKLFTCGSEQKQKQDPTKAPLEIPDNSVEPSPVSREVKTARAVRVQYPLRTEDEDDEEEVSYTDIKTIGKGTFGVVYKARLCHNSEVIAIKKVFDDKRYKNRELLFMKQLHHPNIANLKYYFYTEDAGCRKGERYLNMILEFVPETLFSIAKCDGTYTKPLLDPMYIKVYTYQMFRCLNYLHSLNICHRDIKPQNLLIDPSTHVLKLCDFGSAKELLKDESNVSYICSRYYRAPELIFGAKDYNCLIDMWSAGCVLGELFQGHPLFPGATGPDQLVEIMKVLGTPSYEDIMDINHNITNIRLPPVLVPMPWHKIFSKQQLSYDATNLISQLLVFSPKKRLDALSACAHPFFKELRTRGVMLPDGSPLPPLFDFTKEELAYSPQITERLVPSGWSEDWNKFSASQLPDNFHPEDESLKNKLVKLARNSFKKTSFKREHYEPPTYDVEAKDEEALPTADVLALEARERMKWDDDDSDHHFEELSHAVVDLSMKTTPESMGSEKKKKKSRRRFGSSEDQQPDANGESHEATFSTPRKAKDADGFQDDLDSFVHISKEDESLAATPGDKKPRRKKKRTVQSGIDDGDEGEKWRQDAWSGGVDHLNDEVLRAVSSSTPADLDEGHEEVKVTKKKKVKKQRSRDDSMHGSFDNLEESVNPSPTHNLKAPGRRAKAAKQTEEYHRDESGYDVTQTADGHVVKTVVTKETTVVVDAPRRSKKKHVKHYHDEDEV